MTDKTRDELREELLELVYEYGSASYFDDFSGVNSEDRRKTLSDVQEFINKHF